MISIQAALDAVRSLAPEELQEEWDNSGIQLLTDTEKEISTILTCLEINDDVVEEAVNRNADLIITHHPLFFSKLTSVRSDEVVGAQIIKMILNSISLYSAHTSFDSAERGTNQDLAEKLEEKNDFSLDPTGTEFLKGLWGK